MGQNRVQFLRFYPSLNFPGHFDVLIRWTHILLLPRTVSGPHLVSEFLWQHKPMPAAAPHGRRHLFLTARPMAVMFACLWLAQDVIRFAWRVHIMASLLQERRGIAAPFHLVPDCMCSRDSQTSTAGTRENQLCQVSYRSKSSSRSASRWTGRNC